MIDKPFLIIASLLLALTPARADFGHWAPNWVAKPFIEFIDSANALAITITVPATAEGGDVAVLFDVAWDSGAGGPPVDVIPTGWTGIITATQDGGSNDGRTRISYKRLTDADPGATVTGMDSDTEHKIMFVFRAGTGVRVVPNVWSATFDALDPTDQTVTTTGSDEPLVVMGMAFGKLGTVNFSASTSPAFTATVITSDEDLIAGYTIYNRAQANHTVGMDDEGNSNSLASGYLILR